jgi:hypothetical protein
MRWHSVIAAADSRPIRDRNSKAATVATVVTGAIAAAAGKKMYSRECNRVTAALGRHR